MPHDSRNVRGSLFVDYVRMIKSRKDVDWDKHLAPEDMALLLGRIEPASWYPMDAFERMGNAIFTEIAHENLEAVRLFGKGTAAPLAKLYPDLVAPKHPVDTLRRFFVLRRTFFDFDAFEVPALFDDRADVIIRYYMGARAEEAASYQTMGFFEGVLELAEAANIRAGFQERSWAGDRRTLLVLRW